MSETLTAAAAAADLETCGWRILLQTFATSVPLSEPHRAGEVVAVAGRAAGTDATRLRMDVRGGRVDLTLPSVSRRTGFTADDVEAARRISGALADAGYAVTPLRNAAGDRSVQAWEIAIDAMDIARIRPFWKAVLAYHDEPGGDGPEDALADPVGEGPTVWFQQMDEPRPQRNRIHFDITVPHDEADQRRAAALAAGGTLVSDAEARAFWILADAEGNEVCICTWQDRD
jgi:4a-hydroxytetrahydrobiopterin dehydratase